MCFSASASFTAGVLLTAVGIETIRKVHKPEQILFASITLFFAIQQLSEGVLWMAITHPGYTGVQTIATYFFIIMAQIIWPVMIPLSILLMEKNKIRKKILYVLLAIGTGIGLFDLYSLIFLSVHAEIRGMHITYHNNLHEAFGMPALMIYVLVTVIPFFVSGIVYSWYYHGFIVYSYSCVLHAMSDFCVVLFCGSFKFCNLLYYQGCP
jgi:hypothetical protein